MAIKQISVFVENKPGRLADITGFLADGGISIRAFSIADTTDFGILRLIVSDTDKAAKVLKEHGVAVSITEVVGISIPDVTGAFAKVVKLLSDAGENVEYAYAFLTPEEGHAYVIFRVDNNEMSLCQAQQRTRFSVLKKETQSLSRSSMTGLQKLKNQENMMIFIRSILWTHLKTVRM